MLKNHVLIAWRMLSRNRWYTLIKVLGLALGLCGCIIIWLVGRFELSFDRSHPDKERIYRVTSKIERSGRIGTEVHPPMPVALRTEVTGFGGKDGAVSHVYARQVTGTSSRDLTPVPGSEFAHSVRSTGPRANSADMSTSQVHR